MNFKQDIDLLTLRSTDCYVPRILLLVRRGSSGECDLSQRITVPGRRGSRRGFQFRAAVQQDEKRQSFLEVSVGKLSNGDTWVCLVLELQLQSER
jgi:hypothetical protein